MKSGKTTISSGRLSNLGWLTRIFRGRLHGTLKFIACASFLCLAFNLSVSSVYAQGAGLYKDGKKILDFQEMIDSSFRAAEAAPLLKETAGMKLYKQVFGEKIPSRLSPQKEYLRLVLECRDMVQRITSDYSADLLPVENIDQLLALEEKLHRANEVLLDKFIQVEETLRNSGYPEEKINRHTKMVEQHTLAADGLSDLLANLRSAHASDDQSAVRDVIRELEQYFIDNIFKHDPPFLNSQPLPVMMEFKKAPIIQVDEPLLAARTPYPTFSKWVLGPDPADLDPTIDVQFTDEIIDLANSLNNSPVKMYNYVRDNFEFEAYLGSRKGSQQTLDHMRGNDYDQASLLIALLRVSGIPARYATDTVMMTIEQATNWLGIEDKLNAGSILTTCGMEGIIYIVNDDTVAISCRRVWVEAWLPFINYRGAINDSTGFMWVPMDPTYKQYNYNPGINLPAEVNFDAEAFVFDYISTFHSETPVELVTQRLLDSLAVYHPEATYDDLVTTRSVIKETDGILPGTLPYTLMSTVSTFSEIPSEKRYHIRFHIYGSGTDLDYTTSLPEIVQKQVTISYVGATAADQEIIDTAGGIFNVDVPYLVDLKPALKIDGCEVALGTGSIMMGVTHNSDMHFTTPEGDFNEMPDVYNTIIAGNYQGIGIDTEDAFPAFFDLPETACEELYLGQEVHQTALTYLNLVDVGGDELADLMHQVVMNDVSEAIVANTVTVLFSGGLPQTFEWTGMRVDADRKIIGPFSVDGVDNKCDYMRLEGADGSILENRVFEMRYGEEAISAIKILELASDSGITICDIATSIAADCPGIDQPSHVIDAINNALAQGHHVIIPRRQFTYYQWTGTGWIDIDPVTCAAGYIISGGKSGGETVQEWDISYPDLFCIEPIGPITVTPSATDDLYCSESGEKWTFTVATIKYWGKDEEGGCELLKTDSNKDFPVKYTIKHIAETWGPGTYVFRCGSNTTECGCTMLQKQVTIYMPQITEVDPTHDRIRTRLSPDEVNLPFTLDLIADDATTYNLANESRGGGEYTDDFDFTTMPLKTFVSIRIRWGSGSQQCEKMDDLPVPFQNLGVYRHSQYNTPSEGDPTCQGTPVDVCFTTSSCAYSEGTLQSVFMSQVILNGSGHSLSHGDIQQEAWCQNNGYPPPPNCQGRNVFRANTTIRPSCPGLQYNSSTVARGPANSDLACGDRVLITGLGVIKTVTDRGGGVGATQLDNYTTDLRCSGISDLGNFVTLKLLQ